MPIRPVHHERDADFEQKVRKKSTKQFEYDAQADDDFDGFMVALRSGEPLQDAKDKQDHDDFKRRGGKHVFGHQRVDF